MKTVIITSHVLPAPLLLSEEAPFTQAEIISVCFSGFIPYQDHSTLPNLEPRPPVPRDGPSLAPQSWPNANLTQLVEQRKYSPCHPGIRLSCGPGWRQFAASAGTQLVSEKGDRKMICHPDIPLVCGQEETQGPCNTDIALSCGQGWKSAPFLPRTDQVCLVAY